MSVESGSRVPLTCPSCSAGETVHEVLSPGGQATVRCTECEHVHKHRIPEATEAERKVIVSQGSESFTTQVGFDPDERLAVGEEFIVDSPEALLQARVTGLELGDENRADEAAIESVDTVWSRAIDNVELSVTLHPNDGDREASRSLSITVPGDFEFVVGETESFGDETFVTEGMQIRENAPEYRFDKLDHDGDAAFAKDLKRLYARDDSSTAWSAW
ncbi:MAG: archaeal Zn-finger protein [Halorubrum sp. J07HR59]|nr:MAG: archaeal Zn-finger protein [Halorubrum sp. J07HR59]